MDMHGLREIALLGAMLGGLASAALAAETTNETATRIVFEAAPETNLPKILQARRRVLQERRGAPLTGHQWWLWGLSSFDYDRDGDLDFLVCIHGSTNGMILRNELKQTGKLAFADATAELGVDGFVPSTDDYPLVWDFEGDGDLDIAGLLNDTDTPCLINEDGKRFTKAKFSLHPINHPEAIEDINGDGYLDIRQTRRGRRTEFSYDPEAKVFRKQEADVALPANLPPAIAKELAALPEKEGNRFVDSKFFPCELNGDGRQDLVVQAFGSYSGERSGWYLIARDDGELEDRTEALGLRREGAPMLMEDLDHDGDTDLLVAASKSGGFYRNDGRGKFELQPGPLTDFVKQSCPYLQVAFRVDLDNDGDLDLAVSNRRYGRQVVYENQGDGVFAPVLEESGWDADPLVLRDIDDDGRVDVIIGGAKAKENIGIFLNRTPRPGNYCQLRLRMKPPNVYAVGTRVEIYAAGTLSAESNQTDGSLFPRLAAVAPRDGSPIHVGLGSAAHFDLRVNFPGGAPLVLRNVPAKEKLTMRPEGIASTGD
jgi:hypothetical protein